MGNLRLPSGQMQAGREGERGNMRLRAEVRKREVKRGRKEKLESEQERQKPKKKTEEKMRKREVEESKDDEGVEVPDLLSKTNDFCTGTVCQELLHYLRADGRVKHNLKATVCTKLYKKKSEKSCIKMMDITKMMKTATAEKIEPCLWLM